MAGDLRACVYGQAVGDALGVPFEFLGRDGFRCTGMVGHGTHDQPTGTWSDDTSMALAICDSYRELRRIDVEDIRRRFLAWYREGAYTVDGLFDIGNTTSRALDEGHGLTGDQDNGNGSLMRTMPLAFTDASDDEVRAVSAITHAHPTSTGACVEAVRIARGLAAGMTVAEATGERWAYLVDRSRDWIRSSGFVEHTLEAALWCLLNTGSYRDCVLDAVNLGEDTDTTGAVAGALAGIAYGLEGIPAEWLEALRGKDVIEACLF
jgi:ADP-ribosylglycohydrolase